jgi:uncharacterized protein
MKRIPIIILTLLACMVAQALEVPQLRTRVNDYAAMLSPATVQDLEAKLADLEKTDSTQIAVLTIPGLEGQVIEEFSIKVAESWKIGQKGKDNGAILLIARDDRKIRIEVGRGLEGKLTDLLAGRIIRNEITPRFKAGDFDGGVNAGVVAIIGTVRGEYVPGPEDGDGESGGEGHMVLTMLVIFFFLVIMFGSYSKILGGATGGLGLAASGAMALPGTGLIGLGIFGAVGFLLGFLLSLRISRSSGGRGFFGSYTGGGYSSGGSSSFGGFSGGGGSFGGGGASGGW